MRHEKRRRWRLLAGLGLIALVPLFGARSCIARTDFREEVLLRADEGPRIRVALVRDAPSLDLACDGPLQVLAEGKETPALDLESQETVTVHARRGEIVWGSRLLKSRSVTVVPRGGSLEINGTVFRGDVGIHADRKGSVTCINEIPLEVYLAGVIGAEVPTTWPDAALRAQAIVARTFALHQAWQRRDELYDVTADTLSQVYRGLDAEDQTAFRIIYETRGVILIYGGEIFPTYYMSVCGGHTASSAKVFGGAEIPPLSGRRCGYCRGAPRYRWPARRERVFISEETIVSRLEPLGIPFRRIEKIDGIQTGPDGYAARVSLQTGGETFTVSAQKFRMALGPDLLLSTNFAAERVGSGFVFRGKGWGHGVGMCQWGAHGMGRAGEGERAILQFYYPGAELVRIEG